MQNKNEIVILINSLGVGGAEKVFSLLADELNKDKNLDVHLILLEKNIFYNLVNNLQINYLSKFTPINNHVINFCMLFILAYKLKLYIKSHAIKVVQSHLYRANFVNILAKVLGSKHKIQIVNSTSYTANSHFIINYIKYVLIKWLYKQADVIIYKSYGMRTSFQQVFNFSNYSKIIYNLYDIELINNMQKQESDLFNFSPQKKYLIAIGRLISSKRQADLLSAFNMLKDYYKNLELIFIGDGAQKNILQQQALKSCIENRVHFIDNVQNPFTYISKSNILISCSSQEGFPNVLLESLICGTPVISADCIAGPREILDENHDYKNLLQNGYKLCKYGIIFPIANVKALAAAIVLLLDNLQYCQQLAEKGKRKAVEFDKVTITKQYLHCLKHNL